MSLMPDETSAPSPGDNGPLEVATPAVVNGEDQTSASRVLEYLHDARQEGAAEVKGSAFRKYKLNGDGKHEREDGEQQDGEAGEAGTEQREGRPEPGDGELPAAANHVTSPAGSLSTPDDTPSLHGSVASSSLAGSVLSSRFSPSPSLRPFDRRFQSRLQPGSPQQSPLARSPSPALLGAHSRTSSVGSRIDDIDALDDQSAPWDVVRWTKLKKITSTVFSEAGRRNFGTPTCVTVAATIVLGTSKGIILVFDYHQALKCIIGPGTRAVECGAISALAVSADHSTIAGGHSQGHIFTWEIAKPSRPFLTIQPLSAERKGRTDGHVEGASVLHLGFLGTRHTALVSGDRNGMAFSHLATRGLGAVGRVVKTTRILGRYPEDVPSTGRSRKPTSVLGLSVLPLGNFAEATDSMGLTAMLTPYLLVIVSTTPIAQTQYKSARPKEVASDSALSGCLAWYPSVRLKQGPLTSAPKSTRARLAYCWSNVLTLLELSVAAPVTPEDANRPPQLDFHPRSRFRCDEAIVAVQWISRQIIGILTVTQRLIILEDTHTALRVTETFDLMPKHIMHSDVFSEQLGALVDRMDEEGSFHPKVADAFYNSFKAYRGGRMFLLCSYELSVGRLSNWSDRLLALIEDGDFIGAINLATAYYVGESNKLTLDLPEEPSLRHPVVEEKLLEMMSASLRYAFGKNQSSSRTEILGKDRLQELAVACFEACLSMENTDFLFEEAFEFFEQASCQDIFFETLEPHILGRRISVIPTPIVKLLIAHYTSLELEGRLEEMICQLDTRTLDIDQVTNLCKKHKLYDAMIYVWNRALNDYITPFIDLLTLLLPMLHAGNAVMQNGDALDAVSALKIFPYLSYTLTGRVYPTGEDLPEPEASNAKAQIYYFLFNGSTVAWPKGTKKVFATRRDSEPEPAYPYLHLILQFDAPSFLSALNEAFEDPFLNGFTDADAALHGNSEDQLFGRSLNRQYIVNILLEVMSPDNFPPHDSIYLYMFIARNVPKFPQFIILPGSALHRVLVGLCSPPGEDIIDDCQLSVEYLLTIYRPTDIDELIDLFHHARFYRVLKSIFRAEKQYARLLRTCFDDEEAPEAAFNCIEDCLRPRSGLTDRQIKEVKQVIEQNARKLVDLDDLKTARILDEYAADLHGSVLATIDDRPHDQFLYLRTILEPEQSDAREKTDLHRPLVTDQKHFVEQYIRLMCDYDPEHVSDYVSHLQSGDLRLEKVLPAMETSGVMDAAVVLMAREGQIRQAMDRLIAHLRTLETALIGVLKAASNVEDSDRSNQAAMETVQSLQKYSKVGIWLCQGQMKTGQRLQKANNHRRRPGKDSLTKEEILWLDLLDAAVRISKNCLTLLKPQVNGTRPDDAGAAPALDRPQLIQSLRQFVQQNFSALLAATSTTNSTVSFLHVLRAFLARASLASPSLADLRNVLADIFEAYGFEQQLLALANGLLDKDLFVNVEDAAQLRQRGWRPMSQSCEHCSKRLWGAGAADGIYAAWEKTRIENLRRMQLMREQRRLEAEASESARAKGKGRLAEVAVGVEAQDSEMMAVNGDVDEGAAAVVLFSCRHGFHRRCLEEVGQPLRVEERAFRCVVCADEERAAAVGNGRHGSGR